MRKKYYHAATPETMEKIIADGVVKRGWVGWNLKPDILIHGSPCQDMSIAGHQGKAKAEDGRINRGKGADQGSGTRSSLMWETIHIIEQMGKLYIP